MATAPVAAGVVTPTATGVVTPTITGAGAGAGAGVGTAAAAGPGFWSSAGGPIIAGIGSLGGGAMQGLGASKAAEEALRERERQLLEQQRQFDLTHQGLNNVGGLIQFAHKPTSFDPTAPAV